MLPCDFPFAYLDMGRLLLHGISIVLTHCLLLLVVPESANLVFMLDF